MLTNLHKNKFIIFSWLVFLFIVILIFSPAISFDFRHKPLVGDQASHLMQTLSLAHDADLIFDEGDIINWREVGWTRNPKGLLFQKYSKGYSFAKPYGYSLFLVPFLKVFGPISGIVYGNIFIFTLILVFSIATLRFNYKGVIIPLLVGVFYLASFPYLYIYVIQSDLFLACVVAVYFFLLLSHIRNNRVLYLYSAIFLLAFAISEKIQFLLLMFPLLLISFHQIKSLPKKIIMTIMFIVLILLFVYPYLLYSDFNSWNPYFGDRYYSTDSVPFSPEHHKTGYIEKFSHSHIFSYEYLSNIFLKHKNSPKELLISAWYYLFGAHTGIFVFLPVSGFLLFGTMRRSCFNRQSVAILIGITLYITFYIVFFSTNYYGGWQSIGNRYFLQISPSILALVAVSPISKRFILLSSLFCLLISVLFLLPHHKDPSNAFIKLSRTSWLQRLMPLETNQLFLRAFIDNSKPRNISIVPSFPRWQVLKEDNSYYQLKDGNVKPAKAVTKYGIKYTMVDQGDLFIDSKLIFDNESKKVYIGSGFYDPEGTHVWSSRASSLLMILPRKDKLCLTLHPYLQKTSIEINLPGSSEKTISDRRTWKYKLPMMICLESLEQSGEQTFLKFNADKEASPSKIEKGQNKDPRLLSFLVKFASDYEINSTSDDRILRIYSNMIR